MESYKSYFDCQTVSPELHEKLLAIGRQPRTERRRRPLSPAWKKWAALAACCALALWRIRLGRRKGSGKCARCPWRGTQQCGESPEHPCY